VAVLCIFEVHDVGILPCVSCAADFIVVVFVAVMDVSLPCERVVVAGCAGDQRTKYVRPRSNEWPDRSCWYFWVKRRGGRWSAILNW